MGEISKESSRWLRDVSSRYHNNILQTQRPSGILAVMAITIGITYFLRRRFLPHSKRGCRGLTAAGGTSGTSSHTSYFFSVIKQLQMEDELPRKREEMMGYNPNMRRSQEMQRYNAHNAYNEEMQRYKKIHCNGVSDYTCFLQRYKKMHCDGFDWVLDDICIWVVNALNKEEWS